MHHGIASKSLGMVATSFRKMHDRFIADKPDISKVKEVEMDEMHHYYQKKLKNCVSRKLLIIEITNYSIAMTLKEYDRYLTA